MNTSIIVASLGRCGSTLLFDALGGQRGHFVHTLTDQVYEPGYVYKTHDHAPAELPAYCKAVYLFDNPVDIVLSNYEKSKQQDISQHIINMHGDPGRIDLMFYEDIMRLKANFDSWFQAQTYPVMAMNYRSMWRNKFLIEDFTGRSISLPEYVPRADRRNMISGYERLMIDGTYGLLRARIRRVGMAATLYL